jgi:hypothetical protein
MVQLRTGKHAGQIRRVPPSLSRVIVRDAAAAFLGRATSLYPLDTYGFVR